MIHSGLILLGGAPGARAMQVRWLTSDRKWRFWWLRSRANPKPRKCDMASAWAPVACTCVSLSNYIT